MNRKTGFIAVLLPLVLAAGCSTNYEPIYFASSAKPPTFTETPGKAPGLSKTDESQIQMVVYTYMLQRDLGQGNDYSAFFIQADEELVDVLMKKFPDHTPPIKQSWHIDLRSSQSPVDKDTGRPVMILAAEVSELEADGSVPVIGRWYAGDAVKGYYNFTFRKTGDQWVVASVK